MNATSPVDNYAAIWTKSQKYRQDVNGLTCSFNYKFMNDRIIIFSYLRATLYIMNRINKIQHKLHA